MIENFPNGEINFSPIIDYTYEGICKLFSKNKSIF